jgi:general secretion pathway protein J
MSKRTSGNSRIVGFTLVEVVVALTLLSLVLLGLVSALRSFGQTSARLEAQTLVVDDLRLVSALLQRTISRASSRKYQDPADQVVRTWFAGDADGLVWLGQVPARHGTGGLNHLRLFIGGKSAANDRNRLFLQMSPYTSDENRPDWNALEARILLDDIDSLHLQYQGVGETDWLNSWSEPEVLPGLVRLVAAVRGRSWPPIVIRLEHAAPRISLRAPATSSPLRRF